MTYKYANSEDSSYHKRGNSAIKEVCCSPRQFSKNIWCCSATGWGVSHTFRSKSIQLFKIDETFLTQLIKCNKSEFWFSSWENFFANFVRVSECCLLKIVLVGWSILFICKQSLRIQLSELIFNCPGQLNRWPCQSVTDWPFWLIRRQGQRQRHWQSRAI